jgi:hydroxypyruvate isomerase
MPKFSANLTMLFTETDFLNRFERAAKAGFKAVEFMSPYEYDAEEIMNKVNANKLEIILVNTPAGNFSAGERGIACLPDRVAEFRASIGLSIKYAKALKCPRLNCMTGIVPKGADMNKVKQTYIENLKFAADATQKEGIALEIEPLNNIDMPGTYLTFTSQAKDIMSEVNHPNLGLQYDVYHMQIMEGNLTQTIRNNIGCIKHIQVADNPGRHEPSTGEINFPYLFQAIDEAGYKGWIGAEYKPGTTTEKSLDWAKKYLKK